MDTKELSDKLIIILYMQFVRMAYLNSREYKTIKSLLLEDNKEEAIDILDNRITTWKSEMVEFDKLNNDEKNYIRGEARKILNLLDKDT